MSDNVTRNESQSSSSTPESSTLVEPKYSDFEALWIRDTSGRSVLGSKSVAGAAVVSTTVALAAVTWVIAKNALTHAQLVGVVLVACLIMAFGITVLRLSGSNHAEKSKDICDSTTTPRGEQESSKQP